MSKVEVGDRVKLDGVDMGTVLDVSKSPGNVVVEMDDPALGTEVSQFPGRKVWWLSEDRFTKVRAARKIIITHDGTTTLARMFEGNKAIKSAEAKCAPSDTFDFSIGAKLAFDRLMGREKSFYYSATWKAVREKVLAGPAEKQEPIKLYCIKDFNGGSYRLTNGRTYEIIDKRMVYDGGVRGNFDHESWESYKKQHFDFAACLFPLVQRPAKVGEWVLYGGKPHEVVALDRTGDPMCYVRTETDRSSKTYPDRNIDGIPCAFLSNSEFLVLDGYQPEPECCKCCGQPLKKESAR